MKRRRRQSLRVERANEAIAHLSGIIVDVGSDLDVRNTAARDLIRTCMRHNCSIPENLKRWVCRGCKGALIPGETARIRVRSRVRVTTCLTCFREKRIPLNSEELE